VRLGLALLGTLAFFAAIEVASAQWHAPSPQELETTGVPPPSSADDKPGYCATYVAGVAELVGLENTFKESSIEDMRTIVRNYGSVNVGNLFAILSYMEAQLLDLRVIKYARGYNFSAPLPGGAEDYKSCLNGHRVFLD
jgi:hypothetical protein